MTEGLKLILAPEKIDAIVERLAGEIRRDFTHATPILLGALKGAFVFLADLAREIGTEAEVDFIRTQRYGKRDTPLDTVRVHTDLSGDVTGRDVIVVEGIIDRGKTMRAVKAHLKEQGAASVKLCTLLVRHGLPDDIRVDYAGVEINEDAGFVVGYGMDYKERWRGLSGVYTVEDPKTPIKKRP